MLHTRLTREGWYFLIVLMFIVVGGSMREINLMLVLAGMMIGMLYFNWRAAKSILRRLQIKRRLPTTVHAGDWTVVELVASSPNRAMAIAIEDAIHPVNNSRGKGTRALAVVPQVVPGTSARTDYRLRLDRRGRYEFGPLKLTTRHPFGLVSRTVRRHESGEILVLPRIGRLTPDWFRLSPTPDFGSRRTSGRQGSAEGEFYGLRDWRAGDSRRMIHWRTSARRGGLMVRQFERPRSENLTLLVELWQPNSPTAEDERRVELAVTLAATAALEACRRGECHLRIATAGQEIQMQEGRASKVLAREVLTELATAAADSRNRFEDLLSQAGDNVRARGLTVLVTSRPGARSAADFDSESTNASSSAGHKLGDPAAKSMLPNPAATGGADRTLAAGRARAAGIVTIVAGSDEFFRYFQLPE